jgi:hypothetical protein
VYPHFKKPQKGRRRGAAEFSPQMTSNTM